MELWLQALAVLGGLAALYALWEQLDLWRKRKHLPGSPFVYPFIGNIVEMVQSPPGFYEKLAQAGPVAWTGIVGKFMLHITDVDKIRKILHADEFRMFLHPNALTILGARNIAFMHGPEHTALRKALVPLFTRRALGVYLPSQERLTRDAIASWLAKGVHNEQVRYFIRDLNISTSSEVFVGPYLDDMTREKFNNHYLTMTNGFLTMPINLPGTALHASVQSRKRIVQYLVQFAAESKHRMRAGEQPRCLLDFWMEDYVVRIDKAAAEGAEPPTHSSDLDVAEVTMDFLFASQDASTSSLIWSVALLADHPEVLAKVRAEQELVRPNDDPITFEVLEKLTYTRQVVKEILRFRPPAPYIPQIAVKDFELSPDYTVPQGTIIFPSLWHATQNGFPQQDVFDPDRFSPERGEDTKFGKAFLTFGTGAHYCMGREYAMNHLTVFVSLIATLLDWDHHLTNKSDQICYIPAVIPEDGVLVTLRQRQMVK
eukprot:Unigene5221_Nuclearia_a/m.16029 Unigene5221_Nuclearia_a/g.16029  ORF Unigene5221_Nuclearia_a/g.16029 Unigene5221_Nuclearia_a/m.16029 type:complete len:485 (-) Unigene5221_Nuclearia_a:95-1549(-)